MPSIESNNMGTHVSKSPSKCSTEEEVYYAVYIPSDVLGGFDNEFAECDRVFTNKENALLLIKKNKKIRFKCFRSLRSAQYFAYNGCSQLDASVDALSSDAPPSPSPSALVSGEKPSPFKSLKSQELVKLRKLIEKGNLAEVKKWVWENPRYLVSSGDFPTILQEGCRYNALHISTKALNADMTELLLEIIGDPAFTNLLYDTSTQSNNSYIERSEILLDLYVNTPDKTLNETPLHFASKFGSVDCVRKLLSCAKTQAKVKNKDGKTPLDVVCSRCPNATQEVKYSIRQLLTEEQFFVPMWSSSDACDVPLVGAPCKTNMTPTKMSMKRDENDITSPTLEIKAFAGPMSESSAKAFRNKWKREMKEASPLSSPLTTPGKLNSSFSSFQSPPSVEKSLEIVGRRLAMENNLEWRENWPFLPKCVDLQSSPGLDTLETYLQNKLMETMSTQKVTFELDLDYGKTDSSDVNQESSGTISPIDKLCVNFDTLSLSSHSAKSETSSNSVNNMSHLLMEKSCEVFAKRLLQGLKNAGFQRNRESLVRILRQEAKHLNNLCSSFTQDVRFQGVSLNRIHSMIAKCLLYHLLNSCPPECIEWIVTTFAEISKSKLLDRCSLESESSDTSGDTNEKNENDNASVLCLIHHILNILDQSSITHSESNDNNNTDDLIKGSRARDQSTDHRINDPGSYNGREHSDLSTHPIEPSTNQNNRSDLSTNRSNINDLATHNGKKESDLSAHPSDLSAHPSNRSGLSHQNQTRESGSNKMFASLYSMYSSSFENGFASRDQSLKTEEFNDLGYICGPRYRDLARSLAYSPSASEKEAEARWNQSAPCVCTTRQAPRNLFSNIRSYSRFGSYRAHAWASKGKRIEFDLDDLAPIRGRSVSMNDSSSEKSIAETHHNVSYTSTSSSDSSDTDDEYVTPPSSYTTEQVFMSSSEEEMLDAPDEDTEVYLIGNALSSTDVDAYQTLACCPKVNPVKYPHIYKWRHLVQLKINQDMNLALFSPRIPGTGPRNMNRSALPRTLFSPSVPRGTRFFPGPPLDQPHARFSPSAPRATQFSAGTQHRAYIPLQSSTPSGNQS